MGMSICVLCEHDLGKHHVTKSEIGYKICCYHEHGQITNSTFCKCKAGFKDVSVLIITNGGE